MKKIFAIALALVMVFSMASAFALNDCFSGFDWTCSTDSTLCGKAKFEVVPYVKVNNGCGGFDWQVNDCATAIVSENVYFALKLTVDANVNPEWWAAATGSFESDGLTWLNITMPVDADGNWTFDSFATIAPQDPAKFEYVADLKESEAQVFYLDVAGKWVHEDKADFDGLDADIFAASVDVDGADDAEVCATIASEHDGYNYLWTYGDYEVLVATYTDANGEEIGVLSIDGDCGNEFNMWWEDGKVTDIKASSAAFLNEVKAVFNLSDCVIGTCVDDKIVQRNFGWDDEFEACFKWSDKGAAVVNPECVVAIPKTGDVSVVAYAVMAVVAAAGAMLKK